MALDQHGALLKMGVIVSQHHLTGRLCWSWLSWFICLSTRKWPYGPPGRVLSCPVAVYLGAERCARPLCLPQARQGQRQGRQRLASPGDLVIPYQPPEDVSSVLTMHAVADSWSEGL